MVCCVTGHRPKGFPFPRENGDVLYESYLRELKRELELLISDGVNYFISGMAEGADLDFANEVICIRQTGFEISLEAALPYPLQGQNNKIENRRDALIKKCDVFVEVSPYYFRGCMHKRNRYMVDKSDIILAIWNGE